MKVVLTPFGPPYSSRVGSCGMSQERNASWLRVWSQTVPGPPNSQTSPSPDSSEDFSPPTR